MAINSNFSECDYGRANPKKKCQALAMVQFCVVTKWPRENVVRAYCHAHAHEFDNAYAGLIKTGGIIRTVL